MFDKMFDWNRNTRIVAAGVLAGLMWAQAPAAHAFLYLDDMWEQPAYGVEPTVTWGIVPDGTTLPTGNGEPDAGSSLIGVLDEGFGVINGSSDLTTRPWFGLYQESFERWDQLSGLTFQYMPEDDGARVRSSYDPNHDSPGVPGVRPDIRTGGHYIDGEGVGSGSLAYAYYPDYGDIVFDTGNANLYSNLAEYPVLHDLFSNLIMHEIGHAIGLEHVVSPDAVMVMNTSVSGGTQWGPQFGDILNLHYAYGDRFEAGAGNDTLETATFATTFTEDASWSIGTDAGSSNVVARDAVDFVSIDSRYRADADGEADFFHFTLDVDGTLDALLTSVGPAYGSSGEGSTDQYLRDTSVLSDLALEILDAQGNRVALADVVGLGGSESLMDVMLTQGDYYARITGKTNSIQMYTLDLDFMAVPEPGTFLLVALASGVGVLRRRSRHA
ncbi:MAG: matrixin family metalloprotease [Algisphaera sp.]